MNALDLSHTKNWRQTVNKKSADYFRGYKDGSSDSNEKATQSLIRSLNDVGGFTSQVIDILNEYGIKTENAVLKIETVNSFKVLFCVSEADMLSEQFVSAMSEISDYEESVSSPHRLVTFTFTDTGENFNDKSVRAHGFHFTHSTFANSEKETR